MVVVIMTIHNNVNNNDNEFFHLHQYAIPVDSQLIFAQPFLKNEGLLVQIKCGEHEG